MQREGEGRTTEACEDKGRGSRRKRQRHSRPWSKEWLVDDGGGSTAAACGSWLDGTVKRFFSLFSFTVIMNILVRISVY